MSIDIQQPNYGGLVALAGKNAPLNIEPTGALGLQALQQQQQAQEAAQRNAIARMQVQQQGQLGLLSNQTQNRELDMRAQQQSQQGLLGQNQLELDRQKMGLEVGQNEAEMAYKLKQLDQQGQLGNDDLDLRNRLLAEDTAKRQMAELMEEKKEKIQEKGAFASYGLLTLSGAKTPEEKNMIKAEILREASEKGYMSEQELKVAAQMPNSQFENALKYKLFQYGNVKEHYDVLEAEKPSSSGTTSITLPDGTTVHSSNPTTPVKGQVQKDVIFADDNIEQLKQVTDSVPDNFFGAAAYKQNATSWREWAEKIPGIGGAIEPSSESKKELESYSGLQGKIRNLAMNTIKQLSGLSYTDKQLEFMNDLVPQIGPGAVKSEFKGKANNLLSFYEQIKQDRQKLLRQGIDVNHPEYEEKMLSNMKSAISDLADEGKELSPSDEALRQHFKKNGKSDEEINNWFKNRGK